MYQQQIYISLFFMTVPHCCLQSNLVIPNINTRHSWGKKLMAKNDTLQDCTYFFKKHPEFSQVWREIGTWITKHKSASLPENILEKLGRTGRHYKYIHHHRISPQGCPSTASISKTDETWKVIFLCTTTAAHCFIGNSMNKKSRHYFWFELDVPQQYVRQCKQDFLEQS